MIGGMGQRRPPTGPSPFTAGKPNPMAGFQGNFPTSSVDPRQFAPPGGNPAPRQMPPQQWGGSDGSMGPPGGGGGQGNFPTQQVFGGGYQGSPPWMGGGGIEPGGGVGQVGPGPGPAWLDDPNLQAQVAYPQGGPQGMPDAMMHPFAPRNRGAQGVGPMQGLEQRFAANQADVQGQMRNYLAQMGGGASPVGPQYQRRFPGALQRGILQGMGQPPQATPPAPYGGQ